MPLQFPQNGKSVKETLTLERRLGQTCKKLACVFQVMRMSYVERFVICRLNKFCRLLDLIFLKSILLHKYITRKSQGSVSMLTSTFLYPFFAGPVHIQFHCDKKRDSLFLRSESNVTTSFFLEETVVFLLQKHLCVYNTYHPLTSPIHFQ